MERVLDEYALTGFPMALAHGVGHKKYTPLARESTIYEALGIESKNQTEASIDELKLIA
jgi:hypothetical protein